MKILLIAHQYWPTPGAATQRLTTLVAELISSGASVHVITSAPPNGIAKAEKGRDGEWIHYGAPAEIAGAGARRLLRLGQFAWGVRQIARRLEFDVVVSDPPPTAGVVAGRLARRRGARFVYYMADSWGGAATGASGLARTAAGAIVHLENSVLSSADQVIAATAGMARIAQEAGADNVDVILNGVPIESFSPIGDTWNATGRTRPFFLYAGNAGVVHGAEVFASASEDLWREGLDFDLVYMGYGAEEVVADSLSRWPNRIHLLGNQPAHRVAAAYRAAIGALSSLRPISLYEDARPIKSLTGLACGCPAVYAGDGPFAEVLRQNRLGYVSSYSVEGVRQSLRSAIQVHTTDRQSEQSLRNRCAKYAIENLDNRVSARAAVRSVLATEGNAQT